MRILQTGVTLNDSARATPGFTLFSPLWGNETYIINMAGEVVHSWKLPANPGGYGRLLPNGNLFVTTQTKEGPRFPGGAQGGLMQELDWDGNLVNEYVDHFQHHDARRLANGNTLYAGWEEMPADREKLVTGGHGPHPDGGMYNDYVREVDPDGNTVFNWSTHSMDVDKYPINPMTGLMVFSWVNGTFPLDNGDILISMRHINTVAIINRQTGKLRWEMTDFSWGGQHDAQMLPNGNIILFANGCATYAGHPFSRIIEINPETKEEVWVYKSEPGWH
ncbi:MAG: aryl-sulfate sulfotransferase, partial [Proteobacteria bacterium]|nr:aryl-sulfate sulfotransferase [Pseudomonadota bacterium]